MTSDSAAPREDISIVAFVTTAIWLFCLTVGLLGLRLRYPRPVAPKAELPAVQAQFVNLQITQSARAEDRPPPLSKVAAPSVAPQLTAAALPSPAIAFAKVVEGPTTMVAARYAAPASGPPVQRLVFGFGLGQQPRPDYPREAALAHEEGVVLVRLSVDESGAVTSASAVGPSPFSLLNQSAVRTIRDEWRFPPGPPRLYEVSIIFQLR
jgi:protein TonB